MGNFLWFSKSSSRCTSLKHLQSLVRTHLSSAGFFIISLLCLSSNLYIFSFSLVSFFLSTISSSAFVFIDSRRRSAVGEAPGSAAADRIFQSFFRVYSDYRASGFSFHTL